VVAMHDTQVGICCVHHIACGLGVSNCWAAMDWNIGMDRGMDYGKNLL